MIWSNVPVRAWFATLTLGTFGLVALGMELQAVLHLAPCPLCVFLRLIYLAVGLVALGGVLWPTGRMFWSMLIGLLALLGFGVASYQSWMQAFPQLAPECSYTDPNLIERLVDWLGMLWPSLFLATGFCTSREWVFLGLSMANWSLVVFAGIAGLAALIFRRRL